MNRICLDRRQEPVAVIGAACRLPGGIADPDAFWAFLSSGRRLAAAPPGPGRFADLAIAVPEAADAAIHLDRIDLFDAGYFGISPREAMRMDPQHRLFLELAIEALHDAALAPDLLADRAVGVYLGIYGADYAWLPEAMACPADVHSATGGGPVFAANRLSHALDLRGPSLAVDTTCSSSLVAAHLAAGGLASGDCDLALVGGVNLILSPDVAASSAKSIPAAPTGRCESYGDGGAGAVMAEGGVVLVLKRDSDARQDGDRILARLLGSAVNHDGRASSLTSPNPQAQTEVIRAAFDRSGTPIDRLRYIEGHGTGTELGDAIEIEAAADALQALGRTGDPVTLGSIKAQFGHLEAAAGVAGLLRACLSLDRGRLTAHPLANTPHRLFDETPSLQPAAAGTLEGGAVIGVSAFSLGGTNAHVVVGAGDPGPASTPRDSTATATDAAWIVPISAPSAQALGRQVTAWRDALRDTALADAAIGDIAHTAATGRSAFAHRMAIVADDTARLRAALDRAAGRPAAPRAAATAGAGRDGVVMVFPGHGAQWAGMAAGVLGSDAAFDAAVDRLDALFRPALGWSVRGLLADGGGGDLTAAETAQPALFMMQLALAELFRSRGVTVAGCLGYSAGELAAMVLAGMLDEADAVRLCAARAKRLAAADPGAMMALRLSQATTVDAIGRLAPELALAAVNGPETTVVSGPAAAVRRLGTALEAEGILCLDTGVPYAFHHPAMADASADLRSLFGADAIAWREPTLPIYSSVLGRRLRRADLTADYWQASACATLRFDRATRAALDDDHAVFLEVAPSAALTGDVRDSILASGRPAAAIASLRRGVAPGRALAIAGAELFETGAIRSPGPFNPSTGRAVALPPYVWDHHSHWWPPLPDGARSAPAAAAAPAAGPVAGKLYRLAWPEAPAATGTRRLDPAALADIRKAAGRRAVDEGLADYARQEPRIDRICGAFAGAALADLAGIGAPGDILDLDRLADRLGADAAARRRIARLADIAEAAGFFATDGSARRYRRTPDGAAAQADLARLAGGLPDAAAELDMLARTGPALAAVLDGRQDPLDLLFPGGDATAAADIFSASGIARVMNAMAADVTARIARTRPADRPWRVLEVGAGTGGTTLDLLPHVTAAGGHYTLTDISRTLLRFAERRFGPRDGVEVRRFDVTQVPEDQDLPAGGYDLVVCANVLHAAPDVARAVEHVRRLLAPGGALLLVEAVQPQALVDLTFGLTRDWWGYTDIDRRPDHPLLSCAAWADLLTAGGFADVQILPDDPDMTAMLGCAVILAQPTGETAVAPDLPRRWAVIGPDDPTRRAVAAALEPVSGGVEEIDAEVADLGAAILSTGADGIVDLRTLGPGTADGASAAELLRQLAGVVPGTLALARALAARPGRPPAVVLPGSASTASGEIVGPPDPLQAALAAVAETLAIEHPDWDVRLPDIRPATPAAVAAAIRDEASHTRDGVRPVRLGGTRRRARIERIAATAIAPPGLDPQRLYVVTGGLGALGLEIAEWLAARGARRIVLAQRGHGTEEAAARLADLRARGIAVDRRRVDLSDPGAAAAFAADIADPPGGFGGLVHAAGIFADGLLMAQRWEDFAAALTAKLVGGWELYRALAGGSAGFVVFCGSAAGLLQPAGIGNYAAANGFLGALAARGRSVGLNATALNWGGWSGLGMATRQSARWFDRWNRLGVASLTRDDLHAALDRAVLGQLPAETWVMDVDWSCFAAELPAWRKTLVADLVADIGTGSGPVPAPTATGLPTGEPTDAGTAAPAVEPVTGLDRLADAERRVRIAGVVRRLSLRSLELADHYQLDDDVPLADLGLDSLLALELRSWLCQAFGLDLQPTLLFDCPTAGDLTAHIEREIAAGRCRAAGTPLPAGA